VQRLNSAQAWELHNRGNEKSLCSE
jgi:hypothetical protein